MKTEDIKELVEEAHGLMEKLLPAEEFGESDRAERLYNIITELGTLASPSNAAQDRTAVEIVKDVADGMEGIGGMPFAEEFYTEFDMRLRAALNLKPLPAQDKCEAGCKHFTGGEVKHHKDCKFYPGSLSEQLDILQANASENYLTGHKHGLHNAETILTQIAAAQDKTPEGRTAEEFRKNWLKANPNIIHIPSEHELFLMEEYASSRPTQQTSSPDQIKEQIAIEKGYKSWEACINDQPPYKIEGLMDEVIARLQQTPTQEEVEKDIKIMNFLFNRLVHQYDENPNYDYMQNFRAAIDRHRFAPFSVTQEEIVKVMREVGKNENADQYTSYQDYAAAIHALYSGGREEETEWISFDKRLPEEGQKVDLWVVPEDEEKSHSMSWTWEKCNIIICGGRVTHWRPLSDRKGESK